MTLPVLTLSPFARMLRSLVRSFSREPSALPAAPISTLGSADDIHQFLGDRRLSRLVVRQRDFLNQLTYYFAPYPIFCLNVVMISLSFAVSFSSILPAPATSFFRSGWCCWA